jgi:hypothetical protein
MQKNPDGGEDNAKTGGKMVAVMLFFKKDQYS